jgi:endonuclease/exonuclease/phosphatase family metal-dependent hydrolase
MILTHRLEPLPSLPPAKADEHLRLLTLNLAHGRRHLRHQALARGATLASNLRSIAQTVRGVAPDIVALQEADGPSAWSGNFDHVQTLASLSELPEHYRGTHNALGRGRLALNYGTALLSQLPLGRPTSRRFGANWRDTKGFVVATVSLPGWGGVELDVASVHLDFLTPSVRREQIESLVETLAGRGRPLVVMGDLNCCWRFEPRSMQLLTERLGLTAHAPDEHAPTFPAHRPIRRLDWVLISRELAFAGHHTLPARLSDHLGVVADLRLR